MARLARRIPSSSGSPLAPPKTSPCVLGLLGQARPRSHANMESTVSLTSGVDDDAGMNGDAVGVVLAGGRGARMGGSKAMVELGGEPLIMRPLRALAEA